MLDASCLLASVANQDTAAGCVRAESSPVEVVLIWSAVRTRRRPLFFAVACATSSTADSCFGGGEDLHQSRS
jgi:hypothetical protein